MLPLKPHNTMRTDFILTALIICFATTIFAQEAQPKKEKPYHVWLKPTGYSGINKAILYDVKDSSLRISNPPYSNFSSTADALKFSH